jgi:hypothetical protein
MVVRDGDTDTKPARPSIAKVAFVVISLVLVVFVSVVFALLVVVVFVFVVLVRETAEIPQNPPDRQRIRLVPLGLHFTNVILVREPGSLTVNDPARSGASPGEEH